MTDRKEELATVKSTAEEIRGAVRPKSITPEMVGSAIEGLVDVLAGITPEMEDAGVVYLCALPDITLQVKAGDVVYEPGTEEHATVLALCRAVVAGKRLLGRIIINNVSYTITNTSTELQGTTLSVKLYLSWIEPTQTNTRLRTAKVVLNCVPGADGQEAIDATGNIVLRPIVLRQIDMNTGENLVLDMPTIATLPTKALSKVVPSVRRSAEDVKLIITQTKVDTSSVGAENVQTSLAVATESLAGLMSPQAVQRLNELSQLPPVVETIGVQLQRLGEMVDNIRRYLTKIYSEDPGLMDDMAWDIKENWDPATTSMRSMFEKNQEIRYFPLVDTSNVTDMFQTFYEAPKFEGFAAIDTSSVSNINGAFSYNGLKHVPDLNLSGVKSYNWPFLFTCCEQLETVGDLDLSNTSTLLNAFNGCRNLRKIGKIKLRENGLVNFSQMFPDCTSLKELPLLDYTKANDMSRTFSGCSFEELPAFDTPNCTKFVGTFAGCRFLRRIESIDTSKATDMTNMFLDCYAMEELPILDTSNVTRFACVFRNIDKVTEMQQFDFAKAVSVGEAFACMRGLEYIPPIDVRSAQNISGIIYSCCKLNRFTMLNFGTTPQLTFVELQQCYPQDGSEPAWGAGSEEARQTLVDTLLTHSFDRAAAGYDSCRVLLDPAVAARLTDEEKAAITAKGYTLTQAKRPQS